MSNATSQIFNDINGKHKTSGFEYESIWALGADCTVDNLDKIAEMDHILDDIGIDTIETAVAFGVAMEGGVLDFGDADEMIRIMKDEVGTGTPLGRIIGKPRPIIGIPPWLGYQIGRVAGALLGDVVVTREEIRGLMDDLLYVDSPPAGTTKVSGAQSVTQMSSRVVPSETPET